jgi:hypothetical protein
MESDGPVFDLSLLSFDEFVSLFFDHDLVVEEFWYQDPAFINSSSMFDDDRGMSSPAVVIEHMSRLFTNFAASVSAFSLPQVNAGIWAMFGPTPFVLHEHLWLPSAPLSVRLSCIGSMYFVYSEYVAKSQVHEMENCFYMWWDLVASGFWNYLDFTEKVPEGDVARLNPERRALLDSMFNTLSKILLLPDERVQGCALHGLGHLHHPGVRSLVQKFLDAGRAKMSSEELRWVEQCRDGTVM